MVMVMMMMIKSTSNNGELGLLSPVRKSDGQAARPATDNVMSVSLEEQEPSKNR